MSKHSKKKVEIDWVSLTMPIVHALDLLGATSHPLVTSLQKDEAKDVKSLISDVS